MGGGVYGGEVGRMVASLARAPADGSLSRLSLLKGAGGLRATVEECFSQRSQVSLATGSVISAGASALTQDREEEMVPGARWCQRTCTGVALLLSLAIREYYLERVRPPQLRPPA